MPAPLLIPIAALAMQAVGTGLSMYGDYQSQKAQEDYLKKEATEKKRVAKLNYNYQKGVADDNFQSRVKETLLYKKKGESFLSSQKATGATSGLAQGGSLSVVQAASQNNLRDDLAQMRANAQTEYYQRMGQAEIDLEANSPTYTGMNAGYGMQQWGTALTGASNLIGQGYSMNLWG